jgi:hypothetical protein
MTKEKPNIDKFVRRYRTGSTGGLIATIPNTNILQAKKTFGKGFPLKGSDRGGETDFHFKTNTSGYEKLWRSIKDQKKVEY